MVIDKKFVGTLDQGAGRVINLDGVKSDRIYAFTLETKSNIIILGPNLVFYNVPHNYSYVRLWVILKLDSSNP